MRQFDWGIEIRKTYGPGHYTMQFPALLTSEDFDPKYGSDRSNCPAYADNADYFDQLARLLSPRMPNPVRSR